MSDPFQSSDPLESSGQHAIPSMEDSSTPYSKTPSREMSEPALADMRRLAKVSATLSGVVERQNQVERFARQANERLAKGDVLLETLARRAEDAIRGLEKARDEIAEIQIASSGNVATAQANVHAALSSAQAARDLLTQHQAQCDRRWEILKTQIEQNRIQFQQAQEAKGMNPLVATIIGTILSTLATTAVLGGLWAAAQRDGGNKPTAPP